MARPEGRVNGKVAIVTGGASGIGEETAVRLAEEGAAVCVGDIDVANGQRVVERISDLGGRAKFVRADVSESLEIKNLIDQTEETFGRLDIIHNNAIWFRHGSAIDLEEADWDKTLNSGLKSSYISAKYGVPTMRKSGGGTIVNTASVHSLVSFETCTAYDAAKAGLLGLTRTLAIDFGPDIRVNAVLPGAILTPLWDNLEVADDEKKRYADLVPAKRLGVGRDVANAVLYLVSDEASFVTGTSLVVDGGLLCRTD